MQKLEKEKYLLRDSFPSLKVVLCVFIAVFSGWGLLSLFLIAEENRIAFIVEGGILVLLGIVFLLWLSNRKK
jgi:hypothetical protein